MTPNKRKLQPPLNPEDFIREQLRGEVHGVFIDETASPGLRETPVGLHPDRQSWVAVIVPREVLPEVWRQFPQALKALQIEVGAAEFHFTDIYMKRGAFENVEWDKRKGIIEFMAYIFATYDFPIYVQTLDPQSIGDSRARFKIPDTLPWLNLKKPKDLALFILLSYVRAHLRMTYAEPNRRSRLFVDEGFKKNGCVIVIEPLAPEIAEGAVYFARSNELLPLQLADFAAFVLNRTQLIISKTERTDRDNWFLQVASTIARNYRNLTLIDANDWFGPGRTNH